MFSKKIAQSNDNDDTNLYLNLNDQKGDIDDETHLVSNNTRDDLATNNSGSDHALNSFQNSNNNNDAINHHVINNTSMSICKMVDKNDSATPKISNLSIAKNNNISNDNSINNETENEHLYYSNTINNIDIGIKQIKSKPTFFQDSIMNVNILSKKFDNIEIRLYNKVEKGFFFTNNLWTCYRRNYFQIHCQFVILNKSLNNNSNELIDYDPEHDPVYLDYNNVLKKIERFYIHVTAVNSNNKQINLIQQTPKRDKGPQFVPKPKLIEPLKKDNKFDAKSRAVFERLQFKTATSNNGKRKTTQEHYFLIVQLLADLGDHSDEGIEICRSVSNPIVVRGRSPSHYQESNKFGNPSDIMRRNLTLNRFSRIVNTVPSTNMIEQSPTFSQQQNSVFSQFSSNIYNNNNNLINMNNTTYNLDSDFNYNNDNSNSTNLPEANYTNNNITTSEEMYYQEQGSNAIPILNNQTYDTQQNYPIELQNERFNTNNNIGNYQAIDESRTALFGPPPILNNSTGLSHPNLENNYHNRYTLQPIQEVSQYDYTTKIYRNQQQSDQNHSNNSQQLLYTDSIDPNNFNTNRNNHHFQSYTSHHRYYEY